MVRAPIHSPLLVEFEAPDIALSGGIEHRKGRHHHHKSAIASSTGKARPSQLKHPRSEAAPALSPSRSRMACEPLRVPRDVRRGGAGTAQPLSSLGSFEVGPRVDERPVFDTLVVQVDGLVSVGVDPDAEAGHRYDHEGCRSCGAAKTTAGGATGANIGLRTYSSPPRSYGQHRTRPSIRCVPTLRPAPSTTGVSRCCSYMFEGRTEPVWRKARYGPVCRRQTTLGTHHRLRLSRQG